MTFVMFNVQLVTIFYFLLEATANPVIEMTQQNNLKQLNDKIIRLLMS